MRTLDEQGNEISNPDLTVGMLMKEIIIKDGADPIDNKTKFAWDDTDYEEIMRYVVIPESQRIEDRINELKFSLNESDYIAAKCIDAVINCTSIAGLFSVISSIKNEYGDIISKRQNWRDEINTLEARLLDIKE